MPRFRLAVLLLPLTFGQSFAAAPVDYDLVLDRINRSPVADWGEVAKQEADLIAPADYAAWLQQIIRHPHVISDPLAPRLMRRWGEVDATAALAFTDTITEVGRIPLVIEALRGWSRHDPLAAWEHLRVVSSGFTDLRFDPSGVFVEVANQDPDLALRFFLAVPTERQCMSCLARSLILSAARQKRTERIRRDYENLPEGPHRQALRDAFWNFQGRYGQPDSRSALATVSAADLAGAREQFLRGYASIDFAAALEFALAANDSEAIVPVVDTWARAAMPGEVGEFIAALPEHLGDRAMTGIATTLARVNPAATADWALTFESPALRIEALQRIMSIWARTDPAAALLFTRDRSAVELRADLLSSYLSARVSNHTLELSDLTELDEHFAQGWRTSALARIAARLANPASRSASFLPSADFIAYIESRDDLTPEQQNNILSPFGPR